MQADYSVVIEKDEEGWFVGSVPELPECHTQARSLEELRDRVKEAILLYLEEQGAALPRVEFVGVERVHVSA